ncbi:MAG: hypothetical protein HY875_01230 [Chloroflexi bacterium]|nr:hypothetical protein [Chloroflexota bacterium]
MTNPQPPDHEDLLQDLLEGRLRSRPADPAAGELAGLAARVRQLRPPGPAPAARFRMVARLNATFEGRSRRGAGAWLLGWFGLGHYPRAVTQRFAAGALLLSAVGSGTAAATDVSPLDAIIGIARFAETAFISLTPSSNLPGLDGPGDHATNTATATSTSTTDAGTPGSTATTNGSSTPLPGSSVPSGGGSNGTSGTGGGGPSSPSGTSTGSPPATATPTATPSTTLPGGLPLPTATGTPTPGSTPDGDGATPTRTKTPSPTPTKTSTPTPTPSPTPTATPIPGTLYSVSLPGGPDAGQVRVFRSGDTLTVTQVIANPGWTYTIENASGTSIEVKFEESGSGIKLDFHAELEDGEVKTKVEQE